jgi:glycosyltransferase involved in cell wall biosynthesis
LDNPRVALVSHEYPPYLIGGVGSYCYDLARFLAKKQVQTTVLCGRGTRIAKERISEYLTVIRYPFPDLPLRAYWFQLRNYHALRSVFNDFDVVHAINPQSSATVAFRSVKGHAFVTTMHGVPRFRSRAFFEAPLAYWTLREFVSNTYEAAVDHALHRLCFRNSSKIVTVSRNSLQEARAAFHDFPIGKTVVIPNGIDFVQINKIRRSVGESAGTDEESILFFGRLVWIKGVLHLVKAIAKLRKELPGVRLRIAGTGPLLETLRLLVQRMGLSQNVKFLGYLNHNNLIAEIIRSSIVALPSIYEAGSIAQLEAMACRKPLVAFDYPFAREYITDSSTGMLARPSDADDLADKIRVLMGDKKLRDVLAQNAYELTLRSHNWETLADSYKQIYAEVSD